MESIKNDLQLLCSFSKDVKRQMTFSEFVSFVYFYGLVETLLLNLIS